MKRFIKYIFMFLFLYVSITSKVYASELIKNAKSGVLIDVGSGKILFEKNKDDRVAVASMTKMVGLIIIMEKIDSGEINLDDIVVASSNASGMGGSQIYLSTGEKMSVRDMLRGITMASANDAIVAMAEHISGTEEKFVKLMNDKVKELNLKNTHFSNCTGLDINDHYSSAYDMGIIAMELLKHPAILDFTKEYEGYLRENTNNKFWLVNTNKLVKLYPGVDGLKTGFTDNAKYCISATGVKNNMRLLAIVLGEEEGKIRNKETMELLDYGFNNFKSIVINKKDDIVDTITLDNKKVNLYLKDNLSLLLEKNDNSKIKTEIEITNKKLPLKKNSIVGKYRVYIDSKIVNTVDIYVKEDIKKDNFFDTFINLFKNIIFVK